MSELASRVGVPIVADKVTQEKSRSQFARVLVEVDLTRPPTMSIPIIQPSGKERNQYVIYETFPNYCFECKVYGHHPFTCKVLNKELVENEDAKATNKIVSVANTAANNSKEGGSNQPGDIPKGKKGFNVSGKKSKDDGKGKEIWVEKKKNDVQENGEWVEAKKKKKWVSKPKANVRNLITPKVPTSKAPTTNAAASTSTPKATTPAAQAPKQAAHAPKQAASAQKQTAEAVKVAPRLTVPKQTAETSKASSGSKSSEKTINFPKSGNISFDELGGEIIRNVYDIQEGDVVTRIVYDDNKKKIIYVMQKKDIPSHHQIKRLGPELQKVRDDEGGISFTDECLRKLPRVTPHYEWYKFNHSIFYTYVASFFDVTTRENKKYFKEAMRRFEAIKKMKEGANKEGCQSSNESVSDEF
ncbi:unnamed protein product [Cuscuta europaea]|uniref:DUF4283 domain-containing protein n=1 Tax=Cuscuta europaea TaxID=41803 RepID=A0A9P0ZJK5_CUSEU|nr:unnamed protein product [Cuscuta europaea]